MDKSATERFDYQQQIGQHERYMELLHESQREVGRVLGGLEIEMMTQFRQLQNLQEESLGKGGARAQWSDLERQQQQQHFHKLLDEAQAETNRNYLSVLSTMEEERGRLHSERDALPWQEVTEE